MKVEDMPEYVLKVKKSMPGTTVEERDGRFYLYDSTSTYISGEMPKSSKVYRGRITREGFIPRKNAPMVLTGEMPQEFGLSFVLQVNVTREVQQSIFNGKSAAHLIKLGIIQYVFGSCDPICIRTSCISRGIETELIQLAEKISFSQLDKTTCRIRKAFESRIPDDKERSMFITMLKMVTLPQRVPVPDRPCFPEPIVEIAHKNAIRLYKGERNGKAGN